MILPHSFQLTPPTGCHPYGNYCPISTSLPARESYRQSINSKAIDENSLMSRVGAFENFYDRDVELRVKSYHCIRITSSDYTRFGFACSKIQGFRELSRIEMGWDSGLGIKKLRP